MANIAGTARGVKLRERNCRWSLTGEKLQMIVKHKPHKSGKTTLYLIKITFGDVLLGLCQKMFCYSLQLR